MSIGYTPPPGSRSVLFTGLNGGGTRGEHVMDLNADPFAGRLTNEELDRRAKARYGPNFHGTDTGLLERQPLTGGTEPGEHCRFARFADFASA